MEKVRKPVTRDQLIAYIRKLEGRVRFLESQLREYQKNLPPASETRTETQRVDPSRLSQEQIKPETPGEVSPVHGRTTGSEKPRIRLYWPEKARGIRLAPAKPPTTATAHTSQSTPARKESTESEPATASPADQDLAGEETKTLAELIAMGAVTYPHPADDPVELSVPDIIPPVFKPGQFAQLVLEGENEEVREPLLSGLSQLRSCEPGQRRDVLLKMSNAYWVAVARMGRRLGHENLTWPKRLFLRFGIIDPELLTDRVWQALYYETSNEDGTGVYYLDEWLEAVYTGKINHSTIDELALGGKSRKTDPSEAERLRYELTNIPQMQRMVVGPRANAVTVLTSEYCTPTRDNPLLLREWVLRTYRSLLPFDYKMFRRRYKGEEIEVQPLWLILPGYGTRGGCWEPWNPGNRRTGPRLVVCLFPPRSSLRCIVEALADYRWTYAKEDAMHYWMTEGLTGKFLSLFTKKEQHGKDLKDLFRKCYVHWMINEPRRIPKLDRRMREFFYFNCTYCDEVKATLRHGSLFNRLIEREMAKRIRDQEESDRVKAIRESRTLTRSSQDGTA